MNRIGRLILWCTIGRLILAGVLELGNDEVYYYLYALDLQPNYFDHPPVVGWLIRLTTVNLSWLSEISIRLGAIFSSAAGTWLIYKLGTALKDEPTGWIAAILYNTSIYASLIAGTFIIPDSPQVVCWLAAFWFFHEIVRSAANHVTVGWVTWLMFGFFSGLTILCKVHGIFVWGGFGLYILLWERRLLAAPGLYAAAALSLVVISPVIIWNIQNDFITYKFHSGRMGSGDAWIRPDYFFQTFIGGILYHNPVNFFLIAMALWKLSETKLRTLALRSVLLVSVPVVLVVTVMSLFNEMLPHWSGPGFVVLLLIPAAWLSEKQNTRWVRISAGMIVIPVVAALLLIELFPGTIGSKEERAYGDNDFTLDLYGWQKFGQEFSVWVREEKSRKALPDDIVVVTHKWFPGAHIEYYAARPAQLQVVGVGNVMDIHQYYWLNQVRAPLHYGASALCIVPSNYPLRMEENYLKYFEHAERVKSFESRRGGELARRFDVYLLSNYQMNDEAHGQMK